MKNLNCYIYEAFNNAKKGDEFYTRLNDISKEISNYNLSGKVIYCNCDDPKKSNFYKFFKENFKMLKIKKLIATYYSDAPKVYEYDGKNEKSKNIVSGKFQDNIKYINECDIIITNPPYSNNMPIELIELAYKYNKDFIIVGPLHMCASKRVSNYIKNGKLNGGYTSINYFERPNGSTANAASMWYTNLYVNHPILKTGKKYDKNTYDKYDNYDAIDCNPYSNIPDDYNGKIGVSIRFLGHINRKQFKIIDIINPKMRGKKLMSKLIIQKMED